MSNSWSVSKPIDGTKSWRATFEITTEKNISLSLKILGVELTRNDVFKGKSSGVDLVVPANGNANSEFAIYYLFANASGDVEVTDGNPHQSEFYRAEEKHKAWTITIRET